MAWGQVGQQPAQFLARPIDVHPGGRFRAPQGMADLFIGQFQQVSHHHGRRLPARKAQQGAGDGLAQFLSLQRFLHRAVFRAGRRDPPAASPAIPAAIAPEHVAGAVHADSQHQHLGAGVSPIRARRFQMMVSDSCSAVFGVLGRPRDPPDQSQHLVLDRPDQRVVSRWFAVQIGTSELTGTAAIT